MLLLNILMEVLGYMIVLLAAVGFGALVFAIIRIIWVDIREEKRRK